MPPPKENRWMTRAMWLLMFTPAGALLLFVSVALHLRIGLGRWPTYASGEYQTAAFQVHEQLFNVFLGFTIWGAIPLWLVLVCMQRFRPAWSWKRVLGQLLLFLTGWMLIALFIGLNPSGIVNWYLD